MTAQALTIEELERWVFFGAHWRVVRLSADRVVVNLCACTGEWVGRRDSADPALIEYVSSRRSG